MLSYGWLIVLRVIDWILEHLGIKLREINMKSRKRLSKDGYL